jgi:hypothetical protein
MQPTTTATHFKFSVLRKSHLREDVLRHYQLLALVFLLTSLLTHNLTCYMLCAGFAAVWFAGFKLTSDQTFVRLSLAMAVIACLAIGLVPVL